ncbi:Chemoreceptor glutamine deamidase CheD [Roseobacter fucihabitans]|uniref:Probable chemoreceptor glutamine deamidase CheD n=1 Tax=Roseobacter fucihabitans TaxID=1537242 RepID=A0ABZ2BPP8_9RHOB|nr:chemotaxis protein CheD [Roseobacter litoralis]MBC6965320.1 Chemoreceptor glutamine deamidase CheD [Roseobacter litoralis]MBC6965514.1 Chemoreceptor glutamine deamidase CheD [Roseobacter litoralis]
MQNSRHHITQGEQAVSNDPDFVISTLLGSCVSCCLWDPDSQVGGMNHMLLTTSSAENGVCNLVGINAMELLINEIQKKGGQRNRLRAKAFGGAQMVSGLSEIGRQNSEFILRFLQQEGIQCEGHSLGGETARHIMFWPASGRVMLKIRSDAPTETISQVKAPATAGNDLELF